VIQIYESQPPETRILILHRILRWHLGYQHLTDPTVSIRVSPHFQNYSVLDLFTKYHEFTSLPFQDLVSDAAYPLVTHLYHSSLACKSPELFSDLESDISKLNELIRDGTLALPAFTPIVTEDDSQNPRCVMIVNLLFVWIVM
jgi:hypothetical protein